MIVRIFKPTFTVRRSLLVLGTVMVGLAFPATSMAITDQIKTTPINKGSKGFKLTLFIKQGMPFGYGGRSPNTIAGILFRHTTKGTENDNYTFIGGGGHPLKFQQGANPKALQFAKITGTFANGRGSVNLTFHATGPARSVRVPKGCSGHGGKRRPGTLKGTYTLHADNLGTITQPSFKATISSAAFQCNKATHGYDVQTTGVKPAWVDVFKNKTGSVSEEFDVFDNGPGTSPAWAFDHKYTVSGLTSSHYLVQTPTNLKKATVQGGGGITGTASYTSPGSSPHHTSGQMSGTLAAPFVSIGKIKAFPNGSHRAARQSHS